MEYEHLKVDIEGIRLNLYLQNKFMAAAVWNYKGLLCPGFTKQSGACEVVLKHQEEQSKWEAIS